MSAIDDIEATLIVVAALNEVGYPARVRDGSGITTSVPIPCDVAWRAATLARQARGHPTETFNEWHAHQPPSWCWWCDCGWSGR